MKRPRQLSAGADAEERAAKRLAAHGEAFLSLFGDVAASPRNAVSPLAPQSSSPANSAEASSSASGEAAGDSDRKTAAEAPLSHVEEVFFQPRQRKRAAAPGRRTETVGVAERATPRSERRRFLSGQAESVHRVAAATSAAPPAAAGPRCIKAAEQRDFEQMRREVHTYGAAALDKRQRKAFEAARLQSLDARADKMPRTAAAIGLGIAKKRAEHERNAVEEAIDAGLLQRKGLGKKRRRAALAARGGGRGVKAGTRASAGLREDNGAFRGGVLRVHLGSGGGGSRGRGARGGGSGGRRGGRRARP